MKVAAVEMILVELVNFPSPPVIQPPVTTVVWLKAAEDEFFSPRKFRGNSLALVTSSLRQAGVSITY